MFEALNSAIFLVTDGLAESAIGLVAGAMVAAAAVPQVLRNIARPGEINKQSLIRNLMITVGNAL